MTAAPRPGQTAIAAKGRIAAFKWLILRRLSQAFFLALFMTGPWLGIWIVEGTLASSFTLGFLPLTDPFVALQSILAGHVPSATVATGAAIVLVGYLIAGGRSYCAWVCPVNPVTDLAHWLRERLGLAKGWQPKRSVKYGVLAAALLASGATGAIAWELVNPVTILHRALIFGGTGAWGIVVGLFLFDLLVSRQGWCGHLCPVGAFYGVVGRAALARVAAENRDACDDCMDCYAVCPEPQVITPALKPKDATATPLILSGDCTNCGRCIDVCSKNVFRFRPRFTGEATDARARAA